MKRAALATIASVAILVGTIGSAQDITFRAVFLDVAPGGDKMIWFSQDGPILANVDLRATHGRMDIWNGVFGMRGVFNDKKDRAVVLTETEKITVFLDGRIEREAR